MEIMIYISFIYKGRKSKGLIRSFFEKFNRKDILKHIDLGYFFIRANDSLLPVLRAELKGYTKDWKERRDYSFNSEELYSCKLLELGNKIRPQHDAGPSTRTEYNLDKACKFCGIGAEQIGPLRITKSTITRKRDIITTYGNHYLVSKRVKVAFEQEKVLGVELRQVVSTRGEYLDYYQIIPLSHLPPLIAETGLHIDNQCKYCKRGGYFSGNIVGDPIVFRYRIDEKILGPADVFYTSEYFGYSRLRTPFESSHLATPALVIKPKVMRILEEIKVKEATFFPVEVNEQPDLEKWKRDFMLNGKIKEGK